MTTDVSSELDDSLITLKGRFNLGKAEQRGNPAQLVLLAEHAIKVKRLDVTAECIQLFFKLDPPLNQFHCRALFCKAQYTCPSTCHDMEKLNEATSYLLKAINVAKKSKIYHFLVFNASVYMWQIVRPYQRSGYRQIIARPLANVVKALDEVNEQDHKWRIELMMSLIHCYLDGGHKEDATRVSNSAMNMAKKHCPDKTIDIFKLQLYHHLGDTKQLEKMAKSSDHFLSIYKVYRVKSDARKQIAASGHVNQSELTEKMKKVLDILTGNAPNTQSSLKTSSVASSAPSTPQSSMTSDDKGSLLADLCQLAMEHHCIDIAAQCITCIPYDIQGSVLLLRIEFLRCQLMVKSIEKDNQAELYSKSSVETRLKAIRRMEDALASAARLGEPETTEAGCVIQWNLCLPLLQHNLRHYISKHLLTAAQIMEKIDSLLVKMRCQLHSEVAKCLADEDHLTTAIEHLDKAIQLDELGEYQEQLLHARQRLILKGQLYSTPEDSLHQAAQIIEQINTGTSLAKHAHALLVKAGMAIAPDAFAEAIGSTSRNDTKSSSATPYLVTLADKAKQYVVTKERIDNHKKLMGAERDKERFKLWADLSKVTRKLEVWDIATVASAFCLLYDDGRWEGTEDGKMVQASSGSLSDRNLHSKSSKLSVQRSGMTKVESSIGKSTPSPSDIDVKVSFSDSSTASQQREIFLLRTMAEVYFIHSECLVHAVKMDNILLGDRPSLPAEGQIKDRKFDPESDPDWKSYCGWVQEVTADARNGFVRAAELGSKLHEQWLISNAVVYLWNYSQHILVTPARHVELVDTFRSILNSIKTITLQGEAQLVCELCSTLASGLMVPWIPKPNVSTSTSASPTKGKKRVSSTKKNKTSGNTLQLEVDPSGIPYLREALEVCQYAMSIYNGVPLSVRQPIINTWVETKQLLKETINKNMGHDHEDDPSCGECRSLVAVKMISLQGNMIGDFAQCPSLQESFDLASGPHWSDPLLQLELWSRLSILALKQQDYNLVGKCCDKALEFVDNSKEENAFINITLSNEKRGWELLSIAASIKAQKLAATAQGKITVLRESQSSFVTSASNSNRFGQKASSYNQVMDACKHYWNTCQTDITSVAGRAVLLDQLVELLQILSTLSSRRAIKTDAAATTGNAENELMDQMTAVGLTNEQDLSLRVSMYSVVLQIHSDIQDWHIGLKAVEDAMWVMPRSHHKELAKYKIVFKSKLGKNVEADMVRFHEEAENFKASLWHLAAINATDTNEELLAHQRSIEMLRSVDHQWQKIEYLITFGEWIYWKQLPHEDAINQFEHVIDILLTMPSIVVKPKTPEKPQTSGKSPQAKVTSSKSLNQPTEVEDNKDDKNTNGVSAMNNMKQLEYLMRLHVMIAMVYSERDEKCLQNFLSSLGYVMLIWKNFYAIIAKESHTDLKTLIPATLEQWTCLELNDEMVDQLKSETNELSLNNISLPKPLLTMYFLQLLTDGLCSNDLYHLSVPVLALQLLISKHIIDHSATVTLVHLRLLNLSQQLQLSSCVKYHEIKLSESHLLSPDDISKSREEIACYQIEQEMISTATGKKRAKVVDHHQRGTYQRRILSNKPCLRTVWVEQAHLLIKQGQYQVAREMLSEAELSSKTFEDQHTLSVVFYTQALLAYHEKNLSDMKRLLLIAQKLPADGRMWFAVCELWYETFLNANVKEQLTARSMLWHAMTVFNELKEERRSEEDFVNHAVTILKCRLASFKIHQIVSSPAKYSKRNINDIHTSCEILDAASSLFLNKGLRKEAIDIILLHADTISKVINGDNHRSYLLKAISLYKKALEVFKERTEAVNVLSHTSMLQGASLPVQRMMISVQVKLAKLLIDVSLEDLKDQQQQQRTTSRRCIEQLIDDFVKTGPSLSTSEKEWQMVAKMALEDALTLLISAYHVITNIPELKSQVCYQTGRCLYTIALHKSPDHEMQWNKEIISIISLLKSESRGENQLNPLDHYSALSRVMRKDSANKAEESEAMAIQYTSLAYRSLAKAVKYGLENNDIELVSDAALKLVECCGYYDIEMTCQYLALYQSCVASRELYQLLLQAQADASSSQLASLLQQRMMLQDNAKSSTYIANTHHLNDKYEAWRRQCISVNHLEFMKNFPSQFRIIILQHSPDKSILYGTLLYPPQLPGTVGSGKLKGQQTNSLKTVLASCSVSASDLQSIQELICYYRSDLAQALIRHERSLQVALHQMKLIGKDKCASESLQDVTPEMCSYLQEETRLQSYFEDVLTAVEAYLQPVTETIKDALNAESSSKELDVLLLVDSDLMEFPLESLELLDNCRIRSVSRDFSLQMLYERMKHHLVESTNDSVAGGDKKKSAEKSVMQPSTILADIANIKYVIDPSNDCKASAYNEVCSKLACTLTSEIQSHAKFTSKWTGIVCPETQPTYGEWYSLLKKSSGLIFYGTEHFLSYFPSDNLVPLSIVGCSIVILLDRAQTQESFLSQSKQDTQKSAVQLALEQPTNTARLFSLVGPSCVVINQCYTQLQKNVETFKKLLNGCLHEGKSIARALWHKESCTEENKPASTSGEKNMTEADPVTDDVVIEVASKADTDISSKSRSSHSNFRNTIVYGLPHIILVPPTS